jgi:hypothetical protein
MDTRQLGQDPFTVARYRVEPSVADPAAVQRLAHLRDVLLNDAAASHAGSLPAGVRLWLSNVRSGAVEPPLVLRRVLSGLPDGEETPRVSGDDMDELVRLALLARDPARPFARALLEGLVSACAADSVQAARRIWVELEASMRAGGEATTSRRRLVSAAAGLALLVARINVKEAYELLLGYLLHPWPEVRSVGARRLRHWRGPGLGRALCRALAAGGWDANLRTSSTPLLRRICELADPSLVDPLRGLRGTSLDGPLLSEAIWRCEQARRGGSHMKE